MAKKCKDCLATSQAYKKLCDMIKDYTDDTIEQLRELNLELTIHRLIMNEQGEKENGLRHVGNEHSIQNVSRGNTSSTLRMDGTTSSD